MAAEYNVPEVSSRILDNITHSGPEGKTSVPSFNLSYTRNGMTTVVLCVASCSSNVMLM